MSTYRVHLTEIFAAGADRPWLTNRRILSVESGPCEAPVLIRLGSYRRWIACGRRLPLDTQCRACATVIVVTEVRRMRRYVRSGHLRHQASRDLLAIFKCERPARTHRPAMGTVCHEGRACHASRSTSGRSIHSTGWDQDGLHRSMIRPC
jgi:hypothetical protein